ELGVLAAGRLGLGIDAGRLHRGDRAAGRAVVGLVGAVEAVLADRGDELLHQLLGLLGLPVGRGVLLDDRDLAVEHAVGAVLEQRRIVVGRRAVDHRDLGLRGAAAGQLLEQRRGLQLADSLVVERYVVIRRRAALDQPVIADHRNRLGLGILDDRA